MTEEAGLARVRKTCPSCGDVFGAEVPAEWVASGVDVGAVYCPECERFANSGGGA